MGDRFLIVKLSSIGDVIMASPIAKALRKAKPDAYIAWVVEPKSADMVIGNPYLDEVIVWHRTSRKGSFVSSTAHTVSKLKNLSSDLRSRKFDVAIDAQGLIRSAMVSAISGAKMRVGYDDARECAPLLYNKKMDSPHTLSAQQRYLDLLRAVGVESDDVSMTVPILDEDTAFAESFYKENGLADKKVVAMIPATTWPNKHWKKEYWSRLADLLYERHGAYGLIMGSKADLQLADEITKNSKAKLVCAAGKTTLRQAAALIKLAEIGIAVDTGLMHVSVALQKPTIGIFGPSIWRSFMKTRDCMWLTKELPCSPCHRHPTCEDYPCIWGVTPEEAADAAVPYL